MLKGLIEPNQNNLNLEPQKLPTLIVYSHLDKYRKESTNKNLNTESNKHNNEIQKLYNSNRKKNKKTTPPQTANNNKPAETTMDRSGKEKKKTKTKSAELYKVIFVYSSCKRW